MICILHRAAHRCIVGVADGLMRAALPCVQYVSLSFYSSCYSCAMMHLENILAMCCCVRNGDVCCACVSPFSTAPAQRSQKVYV